MAEKIQAPQGETPANHDGPISLRLTELTLLPADQLRTVLYGAPAAYREVATPIERELEAIIAKQKPPKKSRSDPNPQRDALADVRIFDTEAHFARRLPDILTQNLGILLTELPNLVAQAAPRLEAAQSEKTKGVTNERALDFARRADRVLLLVELTRSALQIGGKVPEVEVLKAIVGYTPIQEVSSHDALNEIIHHLDETCKEYDYDPKTLQVIADLPGSENYHMAPEAGLENGHRSMGDHPASASEPAIAIFAPLTAEQRSFQEQLSELPDIELERVIQGELMYGDKAAEEIYHLTTTHQLTGLSTALRDEWDTTTQQQYELFIRSVERAEIAIREFISRHPESAERFQETLDAITQARGNVAVALGGSSETIAIQEDHDTLPPSDPGTADYNPALDAPDVYAVSTDVSVYSYPYTPEIAARVATGIPFPVLVGGFGDVGARALGELDADERVIATAAATRPSVPDPEPHRTDTAALHTIDPHNPYSFPQPGIHTPTNPSSGPYGEPDGALDSHAEDLVRQAVTTRPLSEEELIVEPVTEDPSPLDPAITVITAAFPQVDGTPITQEVYRGDLELAYEVDSPTVARSLEQATDNALLYATDEEARKDIHISREVLQLLRVLGAIFKRNDITVVAEPFELYPRGSVAASYHSAAEDALAMLHRAQTLYVNGQLPLTVPTEHLSVNQLLDAIMAKRTSNQPSQRIKLHSGEGFVEAINQVDYALTTLYDIFAHETPERRQEIEYEITALYQYLRDVKGMHLAPEHRSDLPFLRRLHPDAPLGRNQLGKPVF